MAKTTSLNASSAKQHCESCFNCPSCKECLGSHPPRDYTLHKISLEFDAELLQAKAQQKPLHRIRMQLLKEQKVSQPWLNVNILDYYQTTIKKGEMESYITPPECISYIFNVENNSASETAENNSNLTSSLSNMAVPASQKLGRPKSKYDLAKRKLQAMNYAAIKFKKLRDNANGRGKE